MVPNPLMGVVYHWLGGLAAGSFYVPYKAVRKWAWETYWLVGGFFSWIIAPWLLAWIMVPDLRAVLAGAPVSSILWAYFWGVMWGIGGLTFGLSVRYLGMSLGYAVALGLCTVFGTLMPPIVDGSIVKILSTLSGQIILLGMLVCVAGVAVAGMAGKAKEREMAAGRAGSVEEFSFLKGILVATVAGVLSASMSYGLTAAEPIARVAVTKGAKVIWSGLPKLVIILAGGFTTNFLWCMFLNLKNGTLREYAAPVRELRVPMLANYFFCAVAGVTWYLQFFFYTMGETQMEKYKFSSWTLHMASIIIFSTLWGVALREWRGTSARVRALVAAGLALLVLSTVVVGYANYVGRPR